MWTKIIAWLFGTPTGRGVLIGLCVAAGVGIAWFAFSSHYESVGYERCQGEHAKALARANAEQARKNEQQVNTGLGIAKNADARAANAISEADKKASDVKEDIKRVYKEPPTTAPVGIGSCVHPLDERVQDRVDASVRAANAAGR